MMYKVLISLIVLTSPATFAGTHGELQSSDTGSFRSATSIAQLNKILSAMDEKDQNSFGNKYLSYRIGQTAPTCGGGRDTEKLDRAKKVVQNGRSNKIAKSEARTLLKLEDSVRSLDLSDDQKTALVIINQVGKGNEGIPSEKGLALIQKYIELDKSLIQKRCYFSSPAVIVATHFPDTLNSTLESQPLDYYSVGAILDEVYNTYPSESAMNLLELVFSKRDSLKEYIAAIQTKEQGYSSINHKQPLLRLYELNYENRDYRNEIMSFIIDVTFESLKSDKPGYLINLLTIFEVNYYRHGPDEEFLEIYDFMRAKHGLSYGVLKQ